MQDKRPISMNHNTEESSIMTTAEESEGQTALSIAFENAQPAKKPALSLKKKRGAKRPDTQKKEKPNALPVSGQTERMASVQQARQESEARDLFRRVIEERKQSEARLKEQEKTYAALLAIGDLGDTADDLARQILYRRLVSQGGKDKLEAALQLLDEQQAALLKRLGLPPRETKPAVGHAGDAGKLEEIPGEYPVPQKEAWHRAIAGEGLEFKKGSLHELIQSAESYFRLYRDEPGHDIRMQHIRQYFRDPAKLNDFLAIHEPSAWAGQFRYMYDNIILSPSGYGQETGSPAAVSYRQEDDDAFASTEALILRNMDRMGL